MRIWSNQEYILTLVEARLIIINNFNLPLHFKASEYPLILTVENHCSIEQQTVMAEHLKNILGDMLLKITIDGKVPSVLPSPEVSYGSFFYLFLNILCKLHLEIGDMIFSSDALIWYKVSIMGLI